MSDAASVVISVAAIVVGAGGALLAQHLNNRVTTKQASAAAQAAFRAERKEAILAFLEVAQRLEEAAEHRYTTHDDLPKDIENTIHQMWFRRKCLELVGSTELSKKAQSYSYRMETACKRDPPKGIDIWGYLREERLPFLVAAREDLGIKSYD